MTSTFDYYLYIMRFNIYFGVCCVDYCSLFPIVLKSLPLRFLVSMRKVEIPKSCFARVRVGRQIMRSLLVN
jgi:hypothetical protein